MFEIRYKQFFAPEDILRKTAACAAELQHQTTERIRFGGDNQYTFPPLRKIRTDGTSRPLLHHGHFLASVNSGSNLDGFWCGSPHVGARVFQFGSHGGGLNIPNLPTSFEFTPKTIRASGIIPRQWLRLSEQNKQKLMKTFMES